MKFEKLIFIVLTAMSILWFKPCDAQNKPTLSEVEQIKQELYQQVIENERRYNYEPQWQNDFEMLQLEANGYMAQNLKLDTESKLLEQEELKLKAAIKEESSKNQELRKKLGAQLEVLDEQKWKGKVKDEERRLQESIASKSKELKEYERDIKSLEQSIGVTRMKLKLMGIEDHSDQLLALQHERDIIEAQIVGQTEQEKELAAKIAEFKSGHKTLDPTVAALRTEIEALRQEISDLELKQESMVSKSGPTPTEQVRILTEQKDNIVAENDRLKGRIEKYKSEQKMGIDNKKTKDLIEAISAVDAANNELNEEISHLKENIIILKVRIKKLEYQADSLKAMKSKTNDSATQN